MRQEYRRRLNLTPALAGNCVKIKADLQRAKTSGETFRQAAAIYSNYAGNPSMFVRFQQMDLTLHVESSSGELTGYERIACEQPTAGPTAIPLTSRKSVHFPDIRSNRIELFDDCTVEEDRALRVATPVGFSKKTGSVLITPLGLERSTSLGFGFIYEYNEENPFSLASIASARTYSSLFTLNIFTKHIAELTGE